MELDLHPLRVLFESEVIAQSRDHTAAHDAHGGPTGEARPPGVAEYRATTESELAESSGEFLVEVGEARPPRVEKYRATTEFELAVDGALPPGIAKCSATAVAKSVGDGEARPPGNAKCSATAKSVVSEPPW